MEDVIEFQHDILGERLYNQHVRAGVFASVLCKKIAFDSLCEKSI